MSENFIKIYFWSSQCLLRSSPRSQDQDHTRKPDTQVPSGLISARASLLPSPPFPHHYPSRPSKPDASSQIGQDPSHLWAFVQVTLFVLISHQSWPGSLTLQVSANHLPCFPTGPRDAILSMFLPLLPLWQHLSHSDISICLPSPQDC